MGDIKAASYHPIFAERLEMAECSPMAISIAFEAV